MGSSAGGGKATSAGAGDPLAALTSGFGNIGAATGGGLDMTSLLGSSMFGGGFDPTGSLGAQDAITGSTTPPSPQDLGGTQSDQSAGQTGNAQQPSGSTSTTPPSVNDQLIASMMAGKPLPTQSATATNPWQLGGGDATSTVQEKYPALDLAGNVMPAGRAMEGPALRAAAGGQTTGTASAGPQPVPYTQGTQTAQQQLDAGSTPQDQPNAMDTADAYNRWALNPVGPAPSLTDTGGGTVAGGAPTTPATAGGATPGAPAATPGAGGAAGGGGMPNIGGIIQDIMGLMSGNPQSLMKLVQDVMRMQQMPMLGGQMTRGGAQGGPIPRGYTVQNAPQWAPGYGPTTGHYSTAQGPGQVSNQPTAGGDAPSTPQNPPGSPANPRQVTTQPAGRMDQAPSANLGSTRGVPGGAWSWTTGGQARAGTFAGEAPSSTVGVGSGATQAAPSRKADGTMPSGSREIAPIVASTARQGGLTNNNGIQGILWNIGQESGFNPANVTRGDQWKHPQYRGTEANNAHGLYQEGAGEWNKYARWLNGRDWRDPKLQTQFLVQNIRQHYPSLWAKLQNARSPEEAAAAFATYYLKPAPGNLINRLARIRRGISQISLPTMQAYDDLTQ